MKNSTVLTFQTHQLFIFRQEREPHRDSGGNVKRVGHQSHRPPAISSRRGGDAPGLPSKGNRHWNPIAAGFFRLHFRTYPVVFIETRVSVYLHTHICVFSDNRWHLANNLQLNGAAGGSYERKNGASKSFFVNNFLISGSSLIFFIIKLFVA